jgi:16S rRNA (cytosine1402-N4)-methyltransferase
MPGQRAVDCTLGGGGHARALLRRILPGGRLLAIEIDPVERPRTEGVLRAEGFGPDVCAIRAANFAELPRVMADEHMHAADVVLADLGVSAMQFDTPARGFSYKGVGPLDMRMNPLVGDTAAALIARSSVEVLERILTEHADEPHAAVIAPLLKRPGCATTHGAARTIRRELQAAFPTLPRADLKMSVRRTFQALRIAVNDEFASLETLLQVLPACLAPGGRVAILTFHSGEDRRVKKAFQRGHRAGLYSAIAPSVIRSAKAETFANRRASAAKLRWAERAR